MCTIPMMFPLDFHGEIYVLQDEKGNTVGTGTRQACIVLLQIITKSLTPLIPADTEMLISQPPNMRPR
jgi:hypothetical protein